MRVLITSCIVGLILLIKMNCIAQNTPQPYFQNYSTEDGLPSPEIYCIFQDSKGYIWIGTDNGAARFDGYEFQNYSAKDGLTQNVVFGIQEDSKGRIWLSTMNGEMFIVENDVITPYEHNNEILRYKKNDGVNTYNIAKLKYIDKEDNLYIELENYGFLVIDNQGKSEIVRLQREVNVNLFMEIENELFGCRISSTYKSSLEEWYLVLKKSNMPSFSFHEKIEGLNSLYVKHVGMGLVDTVKNERLYLLKGHALLYKDTTLQWRSKSSTVFVNEIKKLEKGALITCNAAGKGIFLYENIEAFKNNQFQPLLQGISGNCIFEDQKGGLWIGTQELGLFYTPNLDLRIYDKRFGFEEEHISALTIKNDSTFFVGDAQGNIYVTNTKDDVISETLSSAATEGQYNYDFHFVEKLNILFTSNGFWKGSSFKFYQKKNRTGKLHKVNLKNILHDDSNLYGTHGDYTYSANLKEESVVFDIEKNDIRRSARSFFIHKNHLSRILIGTEKGLYYYGDTTLSPVIADSFLHTRIEDVRQLSDDTYVLATKGKGVVLWKDTIQGVYTEEDGLASDMIERLHVIGDTIWVATLNGLSRIVKDAEKEVRTFNTSTGLPSNEIYDIKSNKGQLWLGTAKGLVKFQAVPENKKSRSPFLSKIEIGEQFFKTDSTAIVHYDQNDIRIDYVTFNYQQQGEIEYRYRLQSEDNWIETKSTTALFTDLRPNDYTFEVQSQNEDDYWSESASYRFCIKSPWYATWWFIGLVGLLISGLIYGRFRRLSRRSAKELIFQKEKLALKDKEVAMQAQIRDLERSALQAQMSPHFIFNCLNSIQNFILENDQKNAVKYLAKFAHLTRQILNLSIDGKVNLQQEIQLLGNYLSLEKLRFKNRFNYTINIEEQIDQESIEIPPLLVQPFIENAIIHGMGSRTEGGKIEVNITQVDQTLQISVLDNGLDVASDLVEAQSKHDFKSVGMSITQKRLALLNEAEEKDMIRFEEMKDDNEDRSGIKVSIFIKI